MVEKKEIILQAIEEVRGWYSSSALVSLDCFLRIWGARREIKRHACLFFAMHRCFTSLPFPVFTQFLAIVKVMYALHTYRRFFCDTKHPDFCLQPFLSSPERCCYVLGCRQGVSREACTETEAVVVFVVRKSRSGQRRNLFLHRGPTWKISFVLLFFILCLCFTACVCASPLVSLCIFMACKYFYIL